MVTMQTYPTGRASQCFDPFDALQPWADDEWLDDILPLPIDATDSIPIGASAAIEWVDGGVIAFPLTITR
jgi:hypothetical protein